MKFCWWRGRNGNARYCNLMTLWCWCNQELKFEIVCITVWTRANSLKSRSQIHRFHHASKTGSCFLFQFMKSYLSYSQPWWGDYLSRSQQRIMCIIYCDRSLMLLYIIICFHPMLNFFLITILYTFKNHAWFTSWKCYWRFV